MDPEGQDTTGGIQDQGQGQPVENNQQDQGTATGMNPAWNDLLGIVPSQLHSQVTPHLQKWDQNYQQGIQKVHSQYEPWKPFIDNGVDPEQVEFSLGLMNAISTNPQEVMTALQEWIDSEGGQDGQNGQQGQFDQTQQRSDQYDPNDITSHPKFREMEEALQTMAQLMLNQRETEQAEQEDKQLDAEITRLQNDEQLGGFDEKWVLSLVANNEGMSLEDGVKEFHSLRENLVTNSRRPGPPVLGSGGAFPNSTPDPRKLDSKDTRNLVASMLQQAKGQ